MFATRTAAEAHRPDPTDRDVCGTAALWVCVCLAIGAAGGLATAARADDLRAHTAQITAGPRLSPAATNPSTTATTSQSPLARLLLPVDGPGMRAELRAADKQWQLAFAVGQGTTSINAAEVVQWGCPAEPDAGPMLLLADGGLIVAEPLEMENETLRVDSRLFGQQSLPLDLLGAVVFQPPAGRLQRDLFLDRLLAAAAQSDRLILANGDELSGVLEGLSEQAVEFRAQFGPLRLERARLAAIVFSPALRRTTKRPPLCALLGFADGTRVLAANLELKQQRAEVTLAAGPAVAAEATQLVCMVPLGGRATYLSDLEPLEFQHTGFLETKWPFRKDRNVLGGMLRVGGQWFPKGLGVHSASRLVYTLDRPYRRFEAELAVDDCAGRQGSVVFRILLDGKQKFASPVLRGGDEPLPVTISLQGAKRLELVVDYADRTDVLDRADWLRARLIR